MSWTLLNTVAVCCACLSVVCLSRRRYSNYVVSLTYNAVLIWFLRCKLQDRRKFASYIIKVNNQSTRQKSIRHRSAVQQSQIFAGSELCLAFENEFRFVWFLYFEMFNKTMKCLYHPCCFLRKNVVTWSSCFGC